MVETAPRILQRLPPNIVQLIALQLLPLDDSYSMMRLCRQNYQMLRLSSIAHYLLVKAISKEVDLPLKLGKLEDLFTLLKEVRRVKRESRMMRFLGFKTTGG